MEIFSSFASRAHIAKHLLKDFKLTEPATLIGTVIYLGTTFKDLYRFLKEIPNGISCSVGCKASEATFFLDSSSHIDSILETIKKAL